MTGQAGRGQDKWYIEKPTTAAMALRAACGGVVNKRSHKQTRVWRSPEGGWTGRRFQLGKNKEVFDPEVFSVWQALRALEQRSEGDSESTIFVDSTSAITRVRDDTRSPGQRFGVAAIEFEKRRAAAGNRDTSAGYRLTLGPRETRWPTSTQRTPPSAVPLERDN